MVHFFKTFFFFILLFYFSINFSFSQNKIDINQASFKELEKLPGIGPKTAKNIIEYREKFGPFKSVEDLIKVKGIGPKKLEVLKNYLEVKGELSLSSSNKENENTLEIYYYKDEKGVIHYTQFPETVTEKYIKSLQKLK